MPYPALPTNLHQAYVTQALECGTNQFFNGTCNDMDPSKNCNTFNPLGGECQTCPNSSYILTGGRCVLPGTCSTGFTLQNYVCVSDLCASANADGSCSSCKSATNEVKADGSCGLKICTSPLILNISSGIC